MLRVENLHAHYGKSHVLQGVKLNVNAGEIVSVLGRNGAGRSSLAKAIMGLIQRTGMIVFKNQNLISLRTCDIARLGVGYVAESRDVFPTLSVQQNLVLGMKTRRPGPWHFDDAYGLFPALHERRSVAAGMLSGGEQQMLALARTMMGNPSLVIIDEPTEGLAPAIVAQVAQFLASLRDRGVAVLLIEQKLAIALSISQRVYVMGHGQMVFDGTPAALRDHRTMSDEYLEV